MSTPRRPDASMSLLTDLTTRPVDPAYPAAASRRVARGLPRSTTTRTPLLAATAALLGFLLAVSAVTVRDTAATVGAARARLLAAVDARSAAVDARAAAVDILARDVTAARAAALRGPDRLLSDLTALETLTGELPLTGPGVRITLDDAADTTARATDPRGPGVFPPGRVSAADLQILTNGLFAAGAEALAVNGHRLTARSAIRFAGPALLVDYRPLTPPYVLDALGDPATLPPRFSASPAGRYLSALTLASRIPTDLRTLPSMTLPAAPASPLRSATPAPAPTPPAP